MPLDVDWRVATRADSPALQEFVCADPPPRVSLMKHRLLVGKPWERVAQGGIRSARPETGDELLLLGIDADGLVAVSRSCFLDGDRGDVKLLAMGVALRARRQGLGDELMRQTLEHLRDEAARAGVGEVTAYGLVHRENLPSLMLCDRWGFVELEPDPRRPEAWQEDHAQMWAPPMHIDLGQWHEGREQA